MSSSKKALMYEYHESFLLNLFLSKEKFVFRFAIPEYMISKENIEIKKGEYLVVDVLCRDCIVKDIHLPHGDFRFLNAEVLDFSVDENGDYFLHLEDGQKFYITFLCSDLQEKDLCIIKEESISDCRQVDPLLSDKIHTLPGEDK